jgi:hypothetical protein
MKTSESQSIDHSKVEALFFIAIVILEVIIFSVLAMIG